MNGNGTTHLYRVEARSTSKDPRKVCGMVLTSEWREVYFSPSKATGVPNETWVPIKDEYHHLLSYHAAVALATWFMAMPEERDVPIHLTMSPALCLETRIVEFKLTYDYKCEEVGVGEPMSLFKMKRSAKFTPRTPPPETDKK